MCTTANFDVLGTHVFVKFAEIQLSRNGMVYIDPKSCNENCK